jgi:hypothetical protein
MERLISLINKGDFGLFTDKLFNYVENAPLTIEMCQAMIEHIPPELRDEYINLFCEVALTDAQIELIKYIRTNFNNGFILTLAGFLHDYNMDLDMDVDEPNHVRRLLTTFKWLLEQNIITETDLRIDIYDRIRSAE